MKQHFFFFAFVCLSSALTISCTNTNSPDMEQSHSQVQDAYVIGIISGLEPVVIQNKAIGKPSRTETRITLTPTSAFDANGNEIPAGEYDDPVFAGDAGLIDQFKKGDKVKIVCTSKTGRHIRTIEKVD
jgi:hypothetical protein